MLDARRTGRWVIPALSLLAGGLYAPFVRAEEEQKAPAPMVEHVQVITSGKPETTESTPASVTVMTREELVRRGAYDLRSALLVAAGIDIAPGGDAGPAGYVPEFWGLKEFDAFLLTVDGVPWGGAFNPSTQTLVLNDVERIEVLRGSAPVTHGATSFVGVINVVHRDPGAIGGQTLRVSGGSFGSGAVSWSNPLPDWAGVKSSLNLDMAHQGYEDERTDFDRGHVRWQNSLRAGAGQVRFAVDGFDQNQDPASPHPRVGTDLTTLVPVDSNQNPRGARLDEWKHTLDTGYERPFASGTWSNTLSISRSRQETLRGFLTDVSTAAPNAQGFRQAIPILDVYFDSHASFRASPKVELTTGVDYLYGSGHAEGGDFDYFVNLDGSGAPDEATLPNQSDVRISDRRKFSGLYGQTVWTPADRWRVEVGARLNVTAESRHTRSEEFSSGTVEVGDDEARVVRGSGFAGFTWTAWMSGADALHLYANYRNTYKPAVIDFGLDADPEILDPETAESYEGGAKTELMNDRLSFELSLFQMDFRNLVVSQSVGGIPTLENAGAERFRGLEFSTLHKPRPDLEWRLVYSLHDARFRDYLTEFGGVPTQLAGNRLEMSARHMAATEVILGRKAGWRGAVRANWVGSRFLNKRNTALAPDYLTWGAGVGYVVGNMEFRLDGYNLNNQRPPVAESELGDAQYYLLPSRRLEASARFFFGDGPP